MKGFFENSHLTHYVKVIFIILKDNPLFLQSQFCKFLYIFAKCIKTFHFRSMKSVLYIKIKFCKKDEQE